MVRVLFIGAGGVNFGGPLAVGSWNHSKRLELLAGVQVAAIADPDLPKAQKVLENKLSGEHASVYEGCLVVANYLDAIKEAKPDVAFIGVPPLNHGSLEVSKDIELQCLKAGVHVFVEKPVSAIPPEEFSPYVQAVEEARKENGLVLSVGYMFRYHPAILQMKEIMENYGRPIMGINARYNSSYSEHKLPIFWDIKCGGPIVEQATHFCDLMRFIGGEVRPETVSALAIPASDDSNDPGYLSAMQAVLKEAEDEIPKERRVPRLTTAQWYFKRGAVGNFSHATFLHGPKYETAIEVWADGLRLALEEPYLSECKLRVRMGRAEEKVYHFPDADPYMDEDRVFLEAVQSGDSANIQSSYSDAAKTYQLSWLIRRASE